MIHILLGAFAAGVAVELAYNYFLRQRQQDDPLPAEITFNVYLPTAYYGPMGIEDGDVIDHHNDADAYEAAVGLQRQLR